MVKKLINYKNLDKSIIMDHILKRIQKLKNNLPAGFFEKF